MKSEEIKAFDRTIEEIMEIAEGFGLDFYPMRFEICPAEVIYTFGAYGMPTRFSHWSFGKTYHKMKLQYDLGMSKIYELVINSDPCYAFLLDSNSLVQNKMIVAHVLAHCDFFKNNVRFSNTRRDMVESMSATAERIKTYEERYGRERVEEFIDDVLSIEEHIDPSLTKAKSTPHQSEKPFDFTKHYANYEDLLQLDAKKEILPAEIVTKFPEQPEKDLLLFIEEHSRVLTDWQRDILTMLREEMLYFWPQMETKIMNEGWASYWHARIMRELDLTTGDAIEYAKLNSNVVQPSRQRINPYYLGIKIFEDIEERYNQPTEDMLKRGVKPRTGREKIFEVREIESDSSFLRNYLTKELVNREDLFLYERKGNEVVVSSKKWEDVRDELVASRINAGFPYIVVENSDYMKNGELYLAHRFEGQELDIMYLEKVLMHVHRLWGRTVHIETIIEDKKTLFSCDGSKVHRKRMD